MTGRRLNAGCGSDTREGWLNVDVRDGPGVDRLVDLNGSWPFDDGEFEVVLLDNVLEHLHDPPATLAEVARVLEDGGHAVIRCPHPNSPGAHRTDHTRTLHPSEFRHGGHYTIPDCFRVVRFGGRRVRLGRAIPSDRLAMWLADTFGWFTTSEWTVVLRKEIDA